VTGLQVIIWILKAKPLFGEASPASVLSPEEPKRSRCPKRDVPMLAVDPQTKLGPLKSAKAQERQSWRGRSFLGVDRNPRLKLQREWESAPETVALAGAIRMEPNIGFVQWHDLFADGDIPELPEVAAFKPCPLTEMLLPDGEIVRQACINNYGQPRGSRIQLPAANFRDTHPDYDLSRLDRFFPTPDDDRCSVIGIRKAL
jgi:hypothetical protein